MFTVVLLFICWRRSFSIYQHIQDRVIQELDEIFGDSDRPATFQDTLEMNYLERCLMETLIIARQIQKDLKLVKRVQIHGDFVVPAGCTVIVGTYKMHRMPEHFPNPDVFDPDNFIPERTVNRHYYAYYQFSFPPRRKYAMLKLKIILMTILRNFRVHSDLTEKDFRLQADIILKRAEGFKLRLTPRKPGSSVRTLKA
ncbi:cytochrome P450 4g15-like [Ctenocephalides felis]|uniref:cytochrome P450 4g15-like n=1 Tax=Ctenocephalides felis TaxID=7515 RepID=UPI000E6E4657|nr:cytochrome P450 4g15-like [Ctenocephalides felis]